MNRKELLESKIVIDCHIEIPVKESALMDRLNEIKDSIDDDYDFDEDSLEIFVLDNIIPDAVAYEIKFEKNNKEDN